MTTPGDRRAYWTVLVERNVPNVGVSDRTDVMKIVNLILEQEQAGQEPNFWHCASTVMGRLPECNCIPCIDARWRPR